MGLFGKKNKGGGRRGDRRSNVNDSAEPYSNMALPPPLKSGDTGFSQMSGLSVREQKDKRLIRLLRFISRLLSLILSLAMTAIFTYSLLTYHNTRSRAVPSSPTKTPWPVPTLLWPTYVLLSISLITFLFNLVTIFMYCCSSGGVKKANKVAEMGSWVGYVLMAVHVGVWAGAVVAYKVGSIGRKDLWGWSCGSVADSIEEEVKGFMSFGMLCDVQTGAFYTSILETALYGLTFIILLLAYRRSATKRKLQDLSSSYQSPLSNTYPANPPSYQTAGGVGFEMQNPYGNKKYGQSEQVQPTGTGSYNGAGYGRMWTGMGTGTGVGQQESGTVFAGVDSGGARLKGKGSGRGYMPLDGGM